MTNGGENDLRMSLIWSPELDPKLSGLRNANAKRCFFLNAKEALAPREASESQAIIATRFLNASVLPRKSLNRKLCWGFPLGIRLPKTRVLERRALERKTLTERKRKRFRNAAF